MVQYICHEFPSTMYLPLNTRHNYFVVRLYFLKNEAGFLISFLTKVYFKYSIWIFRYPIERIPMKLVLRLLISLILPEIADMIRLTSPM